MKFTKENARIFEKTGLKGWVYLNKDDFSQMTCTLEEIDGHHGRTKNTINDKIYFVIEGNDEFDVGGEILIVCKEDVIVIPKGTPYDFKGKMKLLLVNSPAFDRDGETMMD